MDENLRQRIYGEFRRIEDTFLDMVQYIPLVADLRDPRYSIASPRAAEFGLDCCTWVETLMKELLFDPRWDDKIPGIQDARKKRNPDMNLYRAIMGAKLGFARAGYAIRGLGGPEIQPFAEWDRDDNPEWFKTYSRYKHDRIEFAERFTMGHALSAFVALVMLVNHWPPYSPGLPVRGMEQRPFTRVLEGV